MYHISIWGNWNFLWGGQAHQSPPVATGLYLYHTLCEQAVRKCIRTFSRGDKLLLQLRNRCEVNF